MTGEGEGMALLTAPDQVENSDGDRGKSPLPPTPSTYIYFVLKMSNFFKKMYYQSLSKKSKNRISGFASSDKGGGEAYSNGAENDDDAIRHGGRLAHHHWYAGGLQNFAQG